MVTPEEIMIWHTRLLAFLFLIGAILSVLIGIGIATSEEEFQFLPIVVFSTWAAVLVFARNGILFKKRWGRALGFTVSVLLLPVFPIGTGLGIYGIVILRKAKPLFDLARAQESEGDLRVNVKSVQTDGTAATDWPYDILLARSVNEMEIKNGLHDSVMRLTECSWAIDQDSGTITFSRNDGAKFVGPVQVVGTYDTSDGTWMWAWDNPSISESLRQSALSVRAYGENRGVDRLVTRKFPCSEKEAWEFAAVAALMSKADGVYRAPTGKTLVYTTFGHLQKDRV